MDKFSYVGLLAVSIGVYVTHFVNAGSGLSRNASVDNSSQINEFCEYAREYLDKEIGHFGLTEFTIYPFLVTIVSIEERKIKYNKLVAEIQNARDTFKNSTDVIEDDQGGRSVSEQDSSELMERFKRHVFKISKDIGKSVSLRLSDMTEEWGEVQLAKNFYSTCARVEKMYRVLRKQEGEMADSLGSVEALRCTPYRRMALVDRQCRLIIQTD